jgi:hypothetical protein
MYFSRPIGTIPISNSLAEETQVDDNVKRELHSFATEMVDCAGGEPDLIYLEAVMYMYDAPQEVMNETSVPMKDVTEWCLQVLRAEREGLVDKLKAVDAIMNEVKS